MGQRKLVRLVGIGWLPEYLGQLGWYDGERKCEMVNKELGVVEPVSIDHPWSKANYEEVVTWKEIAKAIWKLNNSQQ